MPASWRSSVVLPAPFGPRMPTMPRSTRKLTLARACTGAEGRSKPPMRRAQPRSSVRGWRSGPLVARDGSLPSCCRRALERTSWPMASRTAPTMGHCTATSGVAPRSVGTTKVTAANTAMASHGNPWEIHRSARPCAASPSPPLATARRTSARRRNANAVPSSHSISFQPPPWTYAESAKGAATSTAGGPKRCTASDATGVLSAPELARPAVACANSRGARSARRKGPGKP